MVLLFGRCGCAQYTGHVYLFMVLETMYARDLLLKERYLVSTISISILLLLVVFHSILNYDLGAAG